MNDPNFEQNRIEYKAAKDAADRKLKNGRTVAKKEEKRKYLSLVHLKVTLHTDVAYVSVIYLCTNNCRGFFFEG